MGSFARAFSLRDQRTVEMAETQPANFLLTTRRNVLESSLLKVEGKSQEMGTKKS